MWGIDQVIEELFYAKEAANQQTYTACLDIGDEIAERVLIEYQDVSKVTHRFVNELGGEYSTSKTTRKAKEQGYGICENNDPSEQIFAIFRDDLSHMGEATAYRTAAESPSRFNNEFVRRVDALVTGSRSKCVSAMHQFPPFHSIYFL